MCEEDPNLNIVGLEIRRPVVEFALRRKAQRSSCAVKGELIPDLSNLHYVATNANIDIDRVIRDINAVSSVKMVTVQFPDPHFKKHHKKRRVVTSAFTSSLAVALQPGTRLFVQSDVKDLLQDMVTTISESAAFEPAPGYSVEGISTNVSPVSIQTEREISVLARDLPVYRMLFVKK
jgi:tRNA (guanine-N7-)-methyltransferase